MSWNKKIRKIAGEGVVSIVLPRSSDEPATSLDDVTIDPRRT